MKISFILEDGRLAGPHTYLAELIFHLQGSIEYQLILPNETTDETARLFKSRNIKVVHTHLNRLSKDKSQLLRYLLFFGRDVIKLTTILKGTSTDVVYCAGGSWQIKGIIAGLLSRKKIIWHLNDTNMPLAIRLIFKALVPLVDGVVYASERTKEYYCVKRPARGKIQAVIQSPVDTKKFDPYKNHIGDHELIGMLGNRIVIGTVANVNPIKRIDKLIDTATLLQDLRDKVCFIVVGPVYNSQKEYFRGLQIKMQDRGIENVYFAGGRDNVRPLLSAMDVYICTSDSESSPIAVWEALAMGKMVISTDVGDIRSFADGNAVTVVANGTAKEFEIALRRLLDGRSPPFQVETRNRQIAAQFFDSRICAAKHLTLFKQM